MPADFENLSNGENIDDVQGAFDISQEDDTLKSVEDNKSMKESDKVRPKQEPEVNGLNEDEKKNPNSIRVTLADSKVPIVVLFGPPSCGKTMTLVRMVRYLKKKGYVITPVRGFRPSYDENYKSLCENFDEVMGKDKAASSTNRISFMLVDICKDGRRICQMLEAPGEHYFNPNDPKAQSPRYYDVIHDSSNRKVWTIMLEPNWKDEDDRVNYVARIGKLNRGRNDKVILLYNKIDKTRFQQGRGRVIDSELRNELENEYPSLLDKFKKNVLFFESYDCELVPFQTGYYYDGSTTFQDGPEEYCEIFWDAIQKSLR